MSTFFYEKKITHRLGRTESAIHFSGTRGTLGSPLYSFEYKWLPTFVPPSSLLLCTTTSLRLGRHQKTMVYTKQQGEAHPQLLFPHVSNSASLVIPPTSSIPMALSSMPNYILLRTAKSAPVASSALDPLRTVRPPQNTNTKARAIGSKSPVLGPLLALEQRQEGNRRTARWP